MNITLLLFIAVYAIIESYAKSTPGFCNKRNFDSRKPVNVMQIISGVPLRDTITRLNVPIRRFSKIDLPKSFDARERWPSCSSISYIPHQGNCGSCWAVASAGAMSDRLCIHKGIDKLISAQDLTSCCQTSPEYGFCNGCFGGDPYAAFAHWKNHGIVTGGPHNSSQGCRPYEVSEMNFDPCLNPEKIQFVGTPECKKQCTDKENSYEEEKTWGGDYWRLTTVEDIMTEIYVNGSIVMSFKSYLDFICYKDGVYRTSHPHTSTRSGHAVKCIGWGEEDGVPYWLLVNSLGPQWGNIGGYMKFLRGSNECNIEVDAIAGMPA